MRWAWPSGPTAEGSRASRRVWRLECATCAGRGPRRKRGARACKSGGERGQARAAPRPKPASPRATLRAALCSYATWRRWNGDPLATAQ
eukprot:4717522-Alexandrium_andersonii.AAC.1